MKVPLPADENIRSHSIYHTSVEVARSVSREALIEVSADLLPISMSEKNTTKGSNARSGNMRLL
jgi:hypothetical protein